MFKLSDKEILESFPQEELFAIAGFDISDGHVCNPLRQDGNPGCFYEYFNGVLYFYDFTYFFGKAGINGVEAIKSQTGLTSNWQILSYIKKNIGKNSAPKIRQAHRHELQIKFEPKEWDVNNYYTKYGRELTPEVLVDENVYEVKSYKANSKKYKNLIPNLIGSPEDTLTIAIRAEERVKLYRPFDPKFKWYGVLLGEDVWGMDKINEWSDYVFVVGSNKDYLVMKYVVGEQNCIGLQSEVPIFPKNVSQKFENKKKIIIFDNDDTGIKNSKRLENEYRNTVAVTLPTMTDKWNRKTGKDVSDLVRIYGKEIINNLLYKIKET